MDDRSFFEIQPDRLVLRVRASPGASKNEAQRVRDGELWVRVAAAPEKGRANAELIRFLAGLLKIPRTTLTLFAGAGSRHKKLSVGREALPAVQALADSLM